MLLYILLLPIVLLGGIYIWGHLISSELSIKLNSAPSLGDVIKSYVRAITKIPKRLSIDRLMNSFPSIQISSPIRATTSHLHKYKSKLSITDHEDILPPFYLAALTGDLQLMLVSHPKFPLRMLGSVNTSDEINVHVPARKEWLFSNELNATVRMGDVREARRGIEFDIITQVYRKDTLVWSMTFRALQFMKTTVTAPPPQKQEENKSNSSFSFSLPSNAGRTYASLCRDYNPIHLHDIGAKLLGFPKAMAHGMWVVAHADTRGKNLVKRDKPQQISVYFKKPTFLPAELNVQTFANGFKIERITKKETVTVIDGTIRDL
jgi:hypothetical protein